MRHARRPRRDTLVIAIGSQVTDIGTPGAAERAISLDSVAEVRRRYDSSAGAWWNRRREVGEGAALSAQPADFQRLTFRRGLIRSARIAPDGETILYGALWDGGLCQVHSTRIDNPESRALELPNANLLAVSSNGDLAIALGPNRDGVFTYGTLARADRRRRAARTGRGRQVCRLVARRPHAGEDAAVAGLLLTTEVMIAEAPKDDDHKHGGKSDIGEM